MNVIRGGYVCGYLVNNAEDNCPNIANTGQWDKDQDQIGNECDDDVDGDGFSNSEEELAGTSAWGASSVPEVAEAIYYVHSNHLDAPLALTNQQGGVVWQASYTPFGEITILKDEISEVFSARFPGQYADSETGFYYNYFRDYDPELGRYIQSDPIGLRGGINTYAYVGGNPVGFVDPLGLFLTPQTIGGGVGFLVGFGYSYFVNDCDLGQSLFDGLQAGAAGFISGGGSLYLGFSASFSTSAIRTKLQSGKVDYGAAAISGTFAVVGGNIGKFAGKLIKPKME